MEYCNQTCRGKAYAAESKTEVNDKSGRLEYVDFVRLIGTLPDYYFRRFAIKFLQKLLAKRVLLDWFESVSLPRHNHLFVELLKLNEKELRNLTLSQLTDLMNGVILFLSEIDRLSTSPDQTSASFFKKLKFSIRDVSTYCNH